MDDGLPPIEGDASQVRQAVLNLVHNAAEAARPGQEVHVHVSTGQRSLTHATLESAYLAADLPEGEYVFLRVADDGEGMAPETQGRMFDPFFSTRSTGRGLGLPAVLGIVRGHSGAIHVESTRRVGTTVTIYFPVRSGEQLAAAPPVTTSTTAATDALPGAGAGSILVIDSDEAVRALAARTLERAGYSVVAMPRARAATTGAEGRALTVSCVLIDVSAGDPNAEGDISAVTRLAGSVPIVLMSGFGGPSISEAMASMVTSVLSKPFTPRALRDAIAAAIGNRVAGGSENPPLRAV